MLPFHPDTFSSSVQSQKKHVCVSLCAHTDSRAFVCSSYLSLSLWSAYKSTEPWTDSPDQHTIAPSLPLSLTSSSQTFTVVNTIWNTPPCVGASFRSPGGYEEHCAASSALSRSGEYISFTLSVCLFVLESSVVLKVNVQSYITKVTVSLCKVIANIYTCWTAALLGNLKPSHSEK